MPDLTPDNAKEVEGEQHHKILMLGTAGTGKTTQILTLPRPTFIYIFDPNALESLKGHDIDYKLFLPDRLPCPLIGATGFQPRLVFFLRRCSGFRREFLLHRNGKRPSVRGFRQRKVLLLGEIGLVLEPLIVDGVISSIRVQFLQGGHNLYRSRLIRVIIYADLIATFSQQTGSSSTDSATTTSNYDCPHSCLLHIDCWVGVLRRTLQLQLPREPRLPADRE